MKQSVWRIPKIPNDFKTPLYSRSNHKTALANRNMFIESNFEGFPSFVKVRTSLSN